MNLGEGKNSISSLNNCFSLYVILPLALELLPLKRFEREIGCQKIKALSFPRAASFSSSKSLRKLDHRHDLAEKKCCQTLINEWASCNSPQSIISSEFESTFDLNELSEFSRRKCNNRY